MSFPSSSSSSSPPFRRPSPQKLNSLHPHYESETPPNSSNENLESLPTKLANCGFQVCSRILVSSDSTSTKSHFEAPYIEAINPLGQRIFIFLDNPEPVSPEPTDSIMIRSPSNNLIPHSVKIGAFDGIGLDVSGVALVCQNSICTLLRDDNGPVENNFTPIDKKDVPISDSENPIAYPIVRLSEILTQPDLVTFLTDRATRRLRNVTYENCKHELESTRETLSQLVNAFNQFNQLQANITLKLHSTIKMLEDFTRQYWNLSPNIPPDKYDKVISNLRKRHEYAIDLLSLCQIVSSFRSDFHKKLDLLQQINSYVSRQFKDIEYVIDD